MTVFPGAARDRARAILDAPQPPSRPSRSDGTTMPAAVDDAAECSRRAPGSRRDRARPARPRPPRGGHSERDRMFRPGCRRACPSSFTTARGDTTLSSCWRGAALLDPPGGLLAGALTWRARVHWPSTAVATSAAAPRVQAASRGLVRGAGAGTGVAEGHDLLLDGRVRWGQRGRKMLPCRFKQCGQALAARARDAKKWQAELARPLFQHAHARRIIDSVDLAGRDDLGLGGERWLKELQLLTNGVEIGDRIAAGRARDIDEMHEDLGALEVSQELVAQPKSTMRALDETGNVGHGKAAVAAQADDAEIRRQRGERVV